MTKESHCMFLKLFVCYLINLCFLHLLSFCGMCYIFLFLFPSELYRNAICAPEDSVGEDAIEHVRKSSFNSKLRKGSTCNVIDDSLVVDCPGIHSLPLSSF